jgi:hypothetical protein
MDCKFHESLIANINVSMSGMTPITVSSQRPFINKDYEAQFWVCLPLNLTDLEGDKSKTELMNKLDLNKFITIIHCRV